MAAKAKAPWIQRTRISEQVLKEIYASDQDMYPAPLTFERLKSWVDACPSLSICFQATQEGNTIPIGAVIVLPIAREHWENVIVGNLKETDIDPATMFAPEGEADVGLHVFHIERFSTFTQFGHMQLGRFAEFALEDTLQIVQDKGWNVLGYSALTATPAGRAVCKRMGFRPTGYKEIFKSSETGDIEMICVFPGKDQPTQASGAGKIVNQSEMVVRYLSASFFNEES